MNPDIKISVIIPSYKPKAYMKECLESLKKQTLSNEEYEIIIVLNGCNEPYHSTLKESMKSLLGDKIAYRVLQTEEPGVSNARNIGIEAANGEYITFIDDDDIVSPTYLASLLQVSSETCVGCSNSYTFKDRVEHYEDNFLTAAYSKCQKLAFTHYKYRQFLSPPVCKLLHRSIIGDARFPISIKKSEDSVFCMEISPRIKDMKLATPDCIYYIRNWAGSVTRTKRPFTVEVKEHIVVELAYLNLWLHHPSQYSVKYVLSRMAACARNFFIYSNKVWDKRVLFGLTM